MANFKVVMADNLSGFSVPTARELHSQQGKQFNFLNILLYIHVFTSLQLKH